MKILLVEDDLEISKLLAEFLQENVPYVQKCIRYIMYTNQICIVPPKNSGARLFLLCSTVHNMFLLAKG